VRTDQIKSVSAAKRQFAEVVSDLRDAGLGLSARGSIDLEIQNSEDTLNRLSSFLSAPVHVPEGVVGWKNGQELLVRACDEYVIRSFIKLNGLTRLPTGSPVHLETDSDYAITSLKVTKPEVRDISALGPLNRLSTLAFDYAKIEKFDLLGEFRNLRSFSLYWTTSGTTTDPVDLSVLGTLPVLEEIDLYDCGYFKFDFESGFEGLRELRISRLDKYQLKGLSALRNLDRLGISSAEVIDLSILEGMQHLRQLELQQTNFKGIEYLKTVSGLKKIVFDSRHITKERCNELYVYCDAAGVEYKEYN